MTRLTPGKPTTAALAALLVSAGWTVAATASPARDGASSATARVSATDMDKVKKVKDKDQAANGVPASTTSAASEPAAPATAGAPVAPAPAPRDNAAKDKAAKDKAKGGTGAQPQPAAPQPGPAPAEGKDPATAPAAPEPTELPPAAAPVLARSVAADPVSGAVVVRLPGTSTILPLAEVSSLPVGSVIDARAGTVELTSVDDGAERQSAHFSGAIFSVRQRRAKRPVTVLTLRGGEHSQCEDAPAQAAGLATAAARRKPVRRLWGSGHGRFVTKGRHSAATVRGTVWLTEDRCDGTYTRVERGVVSVRDLGREKTVTVRKGQSYLARAR